MHWAMARPRTRRCSGGPRGPRASRGGRHVSTCGRARSRSSDRRVGPRRVRRPVRPRSRGPRRRRDAARSRREGHGRDGASSGRTPRMCMRANPISYQGWVDGEVVDRPHVVFERPAFDPRRAGRAVEVAQDVGVVEGDAVRSDPHAVAVGLTLQERAVEVTDDVAVSFGDPRLIGRRAERIGQQLRRDRSDSPVAGFVRRVPVGRAMRVTTWSTSLGFEWRARSSYLEP